MRNTNLKQALLVAAVLAAEGYVGVASAHTQNGVLGKAESATDSYVVICSNDGNGNPDRLVADVLDKKPKRRLNMVGITVSNSNGVSVTTTDPIDGDRLASDAVTLSKGDGDQGNSYTLAVHKTLRGPELYKLEFHCMSGQAHTGTDVVRTQNQ